MSKCKKPPAGWKCTRKKGHTGPCAATLDPLDKRLDAEIKKRTEKGES